MMHQVLKTTTLFTLFCLITTSVTAQNRSSLSLISLKTGDYIFTLPNANGKDSLRFGIAQNGDTFTVQHFNKYQQLTHQSWHFDSLYTYDSRQEVSAKYYKIRQNNPSDKWPNYTFIRADSTVQLHSNGQIQHITITESEGFIKTERAFDDNSKLMYSIDNQGDVSISTYSIRRDDKGRIRHASNVVIGNDSKNIKSSLIDTFYFANGQIQEITHYKNHFRGAIGSQKIYNDKGILIESWVDSQTGQPFKDNIACLYGLKNDNGDTILSPKYERIENIVDLNRYVAYTSNTCVLLRSDGSVVPTPVMSDIRDVDRDMLSNYSKNISTTPPFAYKTPSNPVSSWQITPYFAYRVGNETGIIDRNGNVILPPQYFHRLSPITNEFTPVNNLNEQSRDTIKYIYFSDAGHHGANRIGYYDLKGVPIFNSPLNYAYYSLFKDYFIVANRDKHGLMTAENKEILPLQFNTIQPILLTPLFIASKLIHNKNTIDLDELVKKLSKELEDNLSDNNASTNFDNNHKVGVFNAETGQWIIEPIYASVTPISTSIEPKILTVNDLVYAPKVTYFIVSIDSTNKKGLIDIKGNIVLATDKDKLFATADKQISDDKITRLFYYKEKGNYSIFNPEKPQYKYPKNYTFLRPFYMELRGHYKEEIYFIARDNKGKWGVIRGDDAEIILPFVYDYVSSTTHYVDKDYKGVIVLVKNGIATYLYSNYFLSPTSLKEHRESDVSTNTSQLFESYGLIDNYKKIFCVKKDNTVLVPPQYKWIKQEEKYILVENEEGKKYMILIATGQIIEYSENNKMRYSKGDNPLILLKNEVNKTPLMHQTWQKDVFIYSRNTGKQLMLNVNYAIATGDNKHPVFFVKQDTPSIANRFIDYNFLNSGISEDTLHFEDNNWLMYDSLGHLINKTPFRFPINFKNGLGVGMQGNKMGIFKSNGSPFLPPQYDRVWRDDLTGFYYIYEFRGLKSLISVVDSNGKKCLNAGQYDGISTFLGKYALIKSGDKIGVIDTLGNEIINPQDLKRYKGNILDTLKKGLNDSDINKWRHDKSTQNKDYPHFLTPRIISNSDSFINSQAANLLLEASKNAYIMNIRTPKINRVPNNLKVNDKTINSQFYRFNELASFSAINATNAYISFKTEEHYATFINYQFKKDHWELLNNPLFFALDANKTTDLYNLLVKKVRQLKDADIDCGNSNALIEQAKTQFLLTEQGMDIYLDGKSQHDDPTVISLLWSELKGLIKE